MTIIVKSGRYYSGIQGFLVKKFGSITIFVSALHFIEDAILVGLGRYTEVNFFVLLIGTIIFGALIAWIARRPKVKQWLGTD
tara:strand:- start:156 stop:401 length:246 start_codon:yes stop_codon:yes gene_type:complete